MVVMLVMVMVAVVMLMFVKCSLIRMCVGIMVHRHFDIETMRLGDVVQRFPIFSTLCEGKRLSCTVVTARLDGDLLNRFRSCRSKAETWRSPKLVDGKLEHAVFRIHPL